MCSRASISTILHLVKASREPLWTRWASACARGKATRYVTGHCTGDDAYAWLHETLGDRLAYMATRNDLYDLIF